MCRACVSICPDTCPEDYNRCPTKYLVIGHTHEQKRREALIAKWAADRDAWDAAQQATRQKCKEANIEERAKEKEDKQKQKEQVEAHKVPIPSWVTIEKSNTPLVQA